MESTQASNAKRVFVLGALGSGKSTVLNILNGYGKAQQEEKFIASNKLTGCTQTFAYDFIPLPNGEQIQLIDSPGLADPNIPIDMWVSLYNSQIAVNNWGIDLVVVIIEYAERPSSKEYQVFAVLNQALAAIKAENLVILFNKCPDSAEPKDAKDYYETCCSQIQTDSKFPKLSDNNFLVLNRVGKIKRSMQGQDLLNAQLEVNRILSKDVCNFVYQNLAKVKTKVQAKPADRKKLANSFMDAETRKEIQDVHERFEKQCLMYETQIQKSNQEMQQLKQLMAEKEKQQQKIQNEMQEKLRQQDINHKQNLQNLQDKSAAAIAEVQRQNEQQIAQIQHQNQQQIAQLESQIKKKRGGGLLGAIGGLVTTAFGVLTANPIIAATGATLLGASV